MKIIRYALVGSGAIGSVHAQVISRTPGAKLAGIFTRSFVKGQDIAHKFNCIYYESYSALLADDTVDAVVICTPSGAHAEFAIAAASAGKHVIVEKPLEISLEQTDAMIRACQEHGVQLGCVFQRRYSPGVITLKNLISEGRLGKIEYAGCYIKLYRSQEYYDSGAWRGTWELDGGGVLMNQGIHYVDLLQYLAGSVAAVSAQCRTLGHDRIEVEDTAAAVLTFSHGAIGVLEATTNAWPGLVSRIDLYGSEGTAILENEELIYVSLKSGEEFRSQPLVSQSGGSPAISYECHAELYRQFTAALLTGNPVPIDGRESRKGLEIILAVYKSAYLGETITLPLADSRFLGELAERSRQQQGFATNSHKL